MAVPGLPQIFGLGPPSGADAASRPGSGARRSLLDPSGTPTPSFRSLDLTGIGTASPGPVAQPDQGQQVRPRPVREEQPPRTEGEASPNRAETSSDSDSGGGSARTGLRGWLGSLAVGRISMLSGALGFLAQVFGQRGDSGAFSQAAQVDADGSQSQTASGPAVAANANDATAEIAPRETLPVPSPSDTRAGVRAYDFVNRAIGHARRDQEVTGIEFLVSLPFGQTSTSIDQIA